MNDGTARGRHRPGGVRKNSTWVGEVELHASHVTLKTSHGHGLTACAAWGPLVI
jgi:hypothetical protein